VAAAALSLTTGLSSVLVGVMVAVALLPPAATLGIMLGQGNMSLAIGAGLLLAVNIVSVNLASKIVFLLIRCLSAHLAGKGKGETGDGGVRFGVGGYAGCPHSCYFCTPLNLNDITVLSR